MALATPEEAQGQFKLNSGNIKGTLTDPTFSEEPWAAELLFVPPLRSPPLSSALTPPLPECARPWVRRKSWLYQLFFCCYIKLCLFWRYTFPVPPWERLNVEPVVWFGRTLSLRARAHARARALSVCNAEDGRQTGTSTKQKLKTVRSERNDWSQFSLNYMRME